MRDERDRHGEHPLSLLIAPVVALQRAELPLALVLCGLPTLTGNLQKARSYSERLFRGEEIDSLAPEAGAPGIHPAPRADGSPDRRQARADGREGGRGLPVLPTAVGIGAVGGRRPRRRGPLHRQAARRDAPGYLRAPGPRLLRATHRDAHARRAGPPRLLRRMPLSPAALGRAQPARPRRRPETSTSCSAASSMPARSTESARASTPTRHPGFATICCDERAAEPYEGTAAPTRRLEPTPRRNRAISSGM